jgi:hypothetical protein
MISLFWRRKDEAGDFEITSWACTQFKLFADVSDAEI